MIHRIGSLIFALAVGLAVAWFAYDWVTDPLPRAERAREEAVVLAARDQLKTILDAGPALEIVDPLAPNRVAGKVYVYPVDTGWQVSGHYRRGEGLEWHPWLMSLDPEYAMISLAVRDEEPGLLRRAAEDPRLSVTP